MLRNLLGIVFLTIPLSGCLFSSQSGVFKTDEQMGNFLFVNYEAFKALTEMRDECNSFYADNGNGNDLIVTEECQLIFRELDIDDVHYYKYAKNDGSGEYVERMQIRVFHYSRGIFNDYSKGYLYRYNSEDEIELWDGDFNTRPVANECNNDYRYIELDTELLGDTWYLYEEEFCD